MRKLPEDDLITSTEAAGLLGVSANTLRVWRYKAKHLAFRRDGKLRSRVRYRRSDVLAFQKTYERAQKSEWIQPQKNHEWVYPAA